jgi:hypothetical protein
MKGVKPPVGIEGLPIFLAEKQKPFDRDKILAKKQVRLGLERSYIVFTVFILRKKAVLYLFSGDPKVLGQGVYERFVFVPEPDSERRSRTAPILFIELNILGPVIAFIRHTVQRFIQNQSTLGHQKLINQNPSKINEASKYKTIS